MNSDMRFRIDTAGVDVGEQHKHQEPELRALMGAFRFQGHHRTAGIIRSSRAMFSGQIACQSVEVAGGHTHGEIMADCDERELKGKFILLFQSVMDELRAGCVICYIPHPTGVDFKCAAKAFF